MKRNTFTVVLLVVAVITAFSSVYTVNEYEQVLVTRFGQIQGGAISRPGLHVKAPFIDEVHVLDKRWLAWDGDPNQIPTRDKKYIWVDTYARWRISDPVLFYKRLGDEIGAQSRLDDIIDGAVRNVLANHDLIEVVRTSSRAFTNADEEAKRTEEPEAFAVKVGRNGLRKQIIGRASAVMPDYGIELADVRIKRINYVESVQAKVFERMVSERERIAAKYRSEGQGKSAEIRGRIDRELKEIESEAYREAQEIRGRGDAQSTKIYADAFNQDREFYKFLRTLETYEQTIDPQTTLVLSSNSELFQFLKESR